MEGEYFAIPPSDAEQLRDLLAAMPETERVRIVEFLYDVKARRLLQVYKP